MNNWLWHLDDGSLEIFPEEHATGHYGFVYIITNLETNKFYIGKKVFIHNKKKKLTKKEIAEHTGAGRKPTTRVDKVDSGWKSYYGSSKELLSDVKLLGEDKFQRVILNFAKNKKQLTFLELREQIVHNVLFVDDSYNDNIAGKYFRKDFA
jgi:hypothetical protein